MKQKLMLGCGMMASLLYIAMCIFIPSHFRGYHSAAQTISELSAIGAPTRRCWVGLASIYTLLMIAFGWAVWQSAKGNRALRIAALLLLAYSLAGLFWPLAPMHLREDLATGKESGSDQVHLLLAAVTVLLMTGSMAFAAAAFNKQFAIYSIISLLALLFFGVLTARDAPRIRANLPTPFTGIWERINVGIFLLWIIMLAAMLWKRKTGRDLQNTNLVHEQTGKI